MIKSEIYNDPRFIDIGDLPTGFAPYSFKELFARPFTVKELTLLYQGSNSTYAGISHIIRAVNMAVSCDVNDLTDGDFEYVMAWLRLNSYPKAPNQVHWTCKRAVVSEPDTDNLRPDYFDASETELKLKGLVRRHCNEKNVEIVHNAKMEIHTLDDADLIIPYEGLDFPRVATFNEFKRLIKEHPESEHEAKAARWIKEGKTLAEKIKLLNESDIDLYEKILECQTRYYHGISESMTLKCRVCKNIVKHTSYPDVRTFFASNSEQNILDMQYTLLSELKMQPDDDMPAKTLLYHYSSLAKDKQEEQERENLRKAVRKKVR